MVILADQELRELGVIKDSNITVDLNGDRTFSVQIARSNWREELTFSSLIYIYFITFIFYNSIRSAFLCFSCSVFF